MRRVSLAITKLGLSVDDVVKLQLVDTIGNLMVSSTGYSLDESITLTTDTFEYNLLESEDINQISYYKLTLPNLLEFNFTLPYSFENATHDLLSLLSIGCFAGIVSRDGNDTRLDDEFLEKLNLYFTGENPHFNNTERDLVKLYEYYADEVKDTANTIDVMQMMDEYLATLGV